MGENPYTLMFGKEPLQTISRFAQTREIYDAFLADNSPCQIYMITGVRGSGKTVMMTEVSREISKHDEWITVELNPSLDMLGSLAAKLYDDKRIKGYFKSAKINLSLLGIGVGVEWNTEDPISDIEVAISRMLETLKKHNKRLLITIDEVSNSENMKVFAGAFQILVRQDMPIYLLMTGLYENIDALQNEKTLTFLYRAPKIRLKPLSIGSIAAQYKDTFELDSDNAREMAKLTRGYPFAFQVLGYYTYIHGGKFHQAIVEFRQYLDEYVYDKIWSELSKNDKKILYTMAKKGYNRISDIRADLKAESNEFSPYRDRLIKKGILNGDERGSLKFELPLFEEYVLDYMDL